LALAEEIKDKEIASAVVTELISDQRVHSQLTDILASNGMGKPFGSVCNHPAKESVERSDREIKQDIKKELQESPFVDSEKITVTVKDGVATLSGTVDSWTVHAAATAGAYQGGAIAVLNCLKVRDHSPYYDH